MDFLEHFMVLLEVLEIPNHAVPILLLANRSLLAEVPVAKCIIMMYMIRREGQHGPHASREALRRNIYIDMH